jgi:hypothetical protein
MFPSNIYKRMLYLMSNVKGKADIDPRSLRRFLRVIKDGESWQNVVSSE